MRWKGEYLKLMLVGLRRLVDLMVEQQLVICVPTFVNVWVRGMGSDPVLNKLEYQGCAY